MRLEFRHFQFQLTSPRFHRLLVRQANHIIWAILSLKKVDQEPSGSNQANLDPENPISRSTNPSDFGPSSYQMESDKSLPKMPSSSENASNENEQSSSMLNFSKTPPYFSLISRSPMSPRNHQPGFEINFQSRFLIG